MGGFVTRLMWGGDPDVPNPISGLTLRDVYHVQKTWATVYNNSALYGMELFLRLFNKNPETRNFFKLIKNLTDDETRTSFQFKAHVQNFMGSFNTAIVNLNEPEIARALMQKLGDTHNPRHIQKKHFYVLKEIVVGMVTNDLKLSKPICDSWAKFMDFMNGIICEKLQQ